MWRVLPKERKTASSTLAVLSLILTTCDIVDCVYLVQQEEQQQLVPRQRLTQYSNVDAVGNNDVAMMRTDAAPVGICWQRVTASGRCTGNYRTGLRRAACCSVVPRGGWSEHGSFNPRHDIAWLNTRSVGVSDCNVCTVSCDEMVCPNGKVCRMLGGVVRCVCPQCDRRTVPPLDEVIQLTSNSLLAVDIPSLQPQQQTAEPVCGHDGKTYRSRCDLNRYNCIYSKQVVVDYTGTCKLSCDDVRCSDGKRCVYDQHALPHCIRCDDNPCPPAADMSSSVCGVNGMTYSSMCDMSRAACQTGRPVRLAYRGPCIENLTCSELNCDSTDQCVLNVVTSTAVCLECRRPCLVQSTHLICGNNNVTYNGWCNMLAAACRLGILIETKHYGICETSNRLAFD